MKRKAIYLSGGGARGAYQAGVLKAINEIIKPTAIPVNIISSVSAGSINASFIAMHAENFSFAVDTLVNLWSNLSCDKIFHVDNLSLIQSVIRNTASMVFHRNIKGGGYLLDTTPLRTMLETGLDFDKIHRHIDKGLLSAFEIATTCYDTSNNLSFFYSNDHNPGWQRRRHIGQPTKLSSHHILASAAIPLFFPAIEIDQFHYGDGSVRMTSPLRASVHLGADAILAIGTRKLLPDNMIIKPTQNGGISFAKILGNMMNALFLDNLDRDVEFLIRINELIENQKIITTSNYWKPINTLYIYPSEDLAQYTPSITKKLPLLMRYLIDAFGSRKQSSDLLSFILFEADYCQQLIALGYQDGLNQRQAIEKFFSQ